MALRRAWIRLGHSVYPPTMIPTWDAILITVAGPEQEKLYQRQLLLAQQKRRIAWSTVTLAVPDPDGKRIGSGAATLNAIDALARHYGKLGFAQCSTRDMVTFLSAKHVLILHGGDSKRINWANSMGNIFIPLPYCVEVDPDRCIPLLFDHLLAFASLARRPFGSEGGLLVMRGDMLPFFDASEMLLPNDSATIITVPMTVDLASNQSSNHVIFTSKSEDTVTLVDMLQKTEMEDAIQDGRMLLDIGIISARGRAWSDLVSLGCSSKPMISELLHSKKEMSLYEDLVAAWVPSRHNWLLTRPLGESLVSSLGSQKLYSYCTSDSLLLHFRTSSEILYHLGTGPVDERRFSSIPATNIAASSVILSSEIAPGVSIGESSLIYKSKISGSVQIGSLCIVVGIHIPREGLGTPESFRFMLPDRHCLWEVPLVGHKGKVIVYSGLHENPKNAFLKDGTFCGKALEKVMFDLGIEESDLWNSYAAQDRCLWNAKLFPVLTYIEMLKLASWLMGLDDSKNTEKITLWRSSQRVSLEELQGSMNFPEM